MKKILLSIGIVLCCAVVAHPAFAQEEIAGDKQAVKEARQEIKEDASAAKQEEKTMRDQIHTAIQAGEMQRAKELKDQLKAMHHENIEERQRNKQELREAKKELRDNIKAAHKEGKPPLKKFDKTRNPPGAAGGPGTSWKNPPGPKGGPGASPDKRPSMGKPNPPGPRGGPGAGPRKIGR